LSILPTTITVSGNVYEEGTTNQSSVCGTYNIALKNPNISKTTTTCGGGNGAFTFSGVTPPSYDEGMVIWIDSDGNENGTTVVRYDSSGDSVNNIVYEDVVIVMSDNTIPVNIDHMNVYDNAGDSDIPYTANDSPDTLTVNSGYELLAKKNSAVAAGSTVFDPGGTVTTNTTGGDLHVDDDSVAYIDTATSTIGADVKVDNWFG
jgi:hypothetical protein